MKKLWLVFLLFLALIFVVSCGGSSKLEKKDENPDSEETVTDEDPTDAETEPVKEGIYFGIIGFNEFQYIKEIGLLNSSTESSYKSFIDDLTSNDGTGLYFADYTALDKMRSYPVPPKLKNVALVTFTDGLDNISLANDEYNPGNYESTAAYRDAIHNMIVNDKIHETSIAAYTIGLKGEDVTDDTAFAETLNKLASSDSNVFQVENMDEANKRFKDIAKALYSVSKTVSLDVKVPGGYDDGQLLRFTFDNPSAATDSNLYIEATYRRSNGRTLENITYHGLTDGQTTISSASSQGAYYHFVFEDLKYAGTDTPLSDSDINGIMLWKATSTGGWDRESEFKPESSSIVTEDKNSALIMLVLDCTTSLGNDFDRMKQAGKDFVTTLVNGGEADTDTETEDTDSETDDTDTENDDTDSEINDTDDVADTDIDDDPDTEIDDTDSETDDSDTDSQEATYCSAVFNGSSSKIEVASNDLLNLDSETWTIEAWIKQSEEDIPTWVIHPIVRKGASTTPAYILSGYYKNQSGDGYMLTSYVRYSYENWGTNTTTNQLNSNVTFSDNWTHVAMVINKETGDSDQASYKMLLFANGEQIGSQQFNGTPTVLNNDETLFIGTNPNSERFLKGFIDSIKISNTAKYTENFTPSQLSADDSTIAFWDFSGNANDGSGNGLNGTETDLTYSTDCAF